MGGAFSHPVIKKEWMSPKKEGDKIPPVVFKTRVRIESEDENPFDWKDVTSEDYFKDKRVVLFALPGAFTPTCSNTHLPGYEAAYEEIKGLGIDEVYCLSVNDTFVMRQWGLKQGLEEDMTPGANGFKKVKLIPDGAAHFTRGMGMSCMWDKERGFGERSWRYSVVIDNGKIEKLFVEGGKVTQNSGPDPFEVSDAKTMVDYLKSKKEKEEKEEAAKKEEPAAKKEEPAEKKEEPAEKKEEPAEKKEEPAEKKEEPAEKKEEPAEKKAEPAEKPEEPAKETEESAAKSEES